MTVSGSPAIIDPLKTAMEELQHMQNPESTIVAEKMYSTFISIINNLKNNSSIEGSDSDSYKYTHITYTTPLIKQGESFTMDIFQDPTKDLKPGASERSVYVTFGKNNGALSFCIDAPLKDVGKTWADISAESTFSDKFPQKITMLTNVPVQEVYTLTKSQTHQFQGIGK